MHRISIIRIFTISLLPLLVLACAGPAQQPPAPVERQTAVTPQPPPEVAQPLPPVMPEPIPEIEPLPQPAPPPAPDPQPEVSPAVIALLETAREQAAAGADEQAAASLERALRIEPRNPWLWHRLGVLRLQQGRYQEAIDLAAKSNSHASNNSRVQAGNWELIARARMELGDTAGAEQARHRVRELGGLLTSE